MASFFGLGKKLPKPSELVKNAKESVISLEKGGSEKSVQKAEEELKKSLAGIKITICGDSENEIVPENVSTLATEVQNSDLIPLVINSLPKMDFEARKDFVTIFNNLLRRQVNSAHPTVEYVRQKPAIMDSLVLGYDSLDISLNCGAMLRDCARYENLVKLILLSPTFWKFFSYIESANFDSATDSFSTFKELLTKHKPIVADFLEKNYDKFFDSYKVILDSGNYGAKRQSLKLLGELLLDRANFNVMTKYISDPNNLKLMMTMLRDKNKSIQFEAFHVFKVFVANPNKEPSILSILSKNRDRLITFLSSFHNDKEDDQFNDEKAFLIKQVQQLPAPSS
eukprot:TRINITY_DN4546_c0_g1_i1.p1 TRINITY_DN4546_c0_g1~~TRINITY_DN4546_c0_g1_i1.p1  ORF type:complete len:339 (-),score=73.87 TRINITY_DN4546_c0_g1_i1:145-1161(-)